MIYGLRYTAFVSPRAQVDLTTNLRLGKGVVISAFTEIKASDGPLVIGPRTSIGPGCFISAGTGGITIGADGLVGANTVIVANNHRYDTLEQPINTQGLRSMGITIEDDVWVGANSCVLGGAHIGASSIASAGSVISGRVPYGMIVAGNPAKPLFQRR